MNTIGRVVSYEHLGALDGPGLRTVVFLAGCPLRCKYCHNADMLHVQAGRETTVDEVIGEVERYRDYCTGGVTLSGGEPFMQPKALSALCRAVHARGMNVWTYTGFTLEELTEKAATDADVAALLAETDVLVDGRFELGLRNLQLVFRGSENQRVIDMNKTRAAGAVVLLPV